MDKAYSTNPILRRELLSSQRSWRMPVLIVVYNGLMLLLMAGMYSLSRGEFVFTGGSGVNLEFMKGMYYFVSFSQLVLLLLMIPAVTAGSISGERQRGTLDILLVSVKSPWQLISGKLQAGVYSFIILILSSLPLYAIIGVYGGLGVVEVLGTLLTLLVIAITYGALGLAFSTVFKKHQTAMVMSYVAVFLISVLTLILTFMGYGFYQLGFHMEPNQVMGVLLYFNPFVVMMTQLDLQMKSSTSILQIFSGYQPLLSLGLMFVLHGLMTWLFIIFGKLSLRR